MRAVPLSSPAITWSAFVVALLAPASASAAPLVHAASSTPSRRAPPEPTMMPAAMASHRSGYVVGDLIEERAIVTARPGFTLETASLPALHRENTWLTLLRTTVLDRGGTPPRYEVILQYQLSNAPLKARSIELPDVHVRFTRTAGEGTGRLSIAAEAGGLIEGQRIGISPILPPHLVLSTKLLRPDRPAQPLSTLPERLAIGLCAGFASMILAASLAAPILRRRNGPFARAYGRIRRAVARAERPRADAPRAELEALRALHRAFDQTAGWSVFYDRLDAFFAQHTRFEGLREGVERFMQMSRREFFECPIEPRSAVNAAPDRERRDLRWLLEFTRECRARERQVA
jgi:mxaA protein